MASGNTIELRDPTSDEHVATLTGHDRTVTSLVFSPDGTRLASDSDDETIRLWDPQAR